jgi:diguanylate cyclase (GGDEF)-like protein
MVDIDHFKQINDRRGHPAGDWALQRVAELMRATRMRGSDAAFRIGGEEFAIILIETDKAGALAMAERLRQTIERVQFFDDGGRVTLSLGVATLPVDARDGEGLLRQADRALYEAKNAGRNLVIPA